jgi:hypothetical protein
MLNQILKMTWILAMPIYAFSQNTTIPTTPDARISEVFTKEEVDFWQSNNTFLIQRYNYYLDNAWSIIEVDEAKLSAGNYPEVSISDLSKVNILLVEKENKVNRNFDRPTIYRIKGQNKLLVYLSEKEFSQKLNKALGRK